MIPEVQNSVRLYHDMKAPFNDFLAVQRIISQKLRMPHIGITPETTFSSLAALGADCRHYIDIIAALEAEFNICISDNDCENIVNVRDILDCIKRRSSQRYH